MKFSPLQRTLLVMALVFSACAIVWSGQPKGWDEKARQRKADYVLLEAQNAYGREEYDAYKMLVDYAYLLDSADYDIAAEWGMKHIYDLDSATVEQSYSYIIRQFFAAEPDINTGIVAMNIARSMGRLRDMLAICERLDSAFPKNPEPARSIAHANVLLYAYENDTDAYNRAMEIYDRMEREQGINVEVSSMKASLCLIKEDTAAMIKEVCRLEASAPDDSYTQMYAGMMYESIDSNQLAYRNFKRACELDSTNGYAFLALARNYGAMGDTLAYNQEVVKAMRSPNLEFDQKFDILRSYVMYVIKDSTQQGSITALFDDMVDLHPGEPQLRDMYSTYLDLVGDTVGMIEQLEYLVALEPKNMNNWMRLLHDMISVNPQRAIEYGREALPLFPDNVYFPFAVSMLLFQQDSVQQALDVINDFDVTRDDLPPTGVATLLTSKGDMLARLGDTDSAISTYEEALKYDPDEAMAMNNAAYFLSLKGEDLDKAEAYSHKAIVAEPTNISYLDTYAWVMFKKGQYQDAKIYIDLVFANYDAQSDDTDGDAVAVENAKEPTAEVYEHAGDIYFMCGDPDQALTYWKEALKLDPGNELLQRKVKNKTYFYK